MLLLFFQWQQNSHAPLAPHNNNNNKGNNSANTNQKEVEENMQHLSPVCLFFCSLFFDFFVLFCLLDLPDICRKHCVNVAIASPEARAVARSTEETLAPTPAPAAAPQTMNTYRNEAKHSLMMDLQRGHSERVR